jgi:hypothetical protein
MVVQLCRSSICLLCRLWVHALAVFNIYVDTHLHQPVAVSSRRGLRVASVHRASRRLPRVFTPPTSR